MRCDLKCPFETPNGGHCCINCSDSRKDLKDVYPDKWDDKAGFWSKDGCRLGEDRPQTCKDYDCKKYVFFVTMSYVDGKWIAVSMYEVLKEKRDREFIHKYNALFEDVRNDP